MVKKLSKILKEKIKEALKMPDATLDVIVEINSEDFRRSIEESIYHHNVGIQDLLKTYTQAMDYEQDSIVRYFQIPGGPVGYIVTGKKYTGFINPEEDAR